MSPSLVLYCTSADGVEQVWLVDEVEGERGDELRLMRSGSHILTLGPEDYAASLTIAPFGGAKTH